MATANTEVATKAAAYGIPGVAVDGNDVLAVWEAARVAVERARKGEGPTLIEAKTYRTVGHHEGDPAGRHLSHAGRTRSVEDPLPDRALPAEAVGLGPRERARSGRRSKQRSTRCVHESLEFSRHAPHPDPAKANDHVWAEPLASRPARRRSQRPKPSCKDIWKPCATRWPRKCAAIRTPSTWAREPASAAAALPTPRACGTSSAASG